MDAGLLVARIVHVLAGVLWVGTLFFFAAFLDPAVSDMGRDGGKLFTALVRRKFLAFLPIVALLTVFSGFYLYWHASSGFDPVYMRSGPGRTYGIGAASAILAFIIGVSVVRPAASKMIRLAQEAESGQSADAGQMEAYHRRATTAGRIVTALLIITATAMAIGRYT